MRSIVVGMVLVGCAPASTQPQPSYFSQPQQPPPVYAPDPDAEAPYEGDEPAGYPQEPGPASSPSGYPPAPAPAANRLLRCGELITACSGGDTNACVQTRGTPRAQWLVLGIAKCAASQGCTVQWCIEQGCSTSMALCRADASDATTPAAPVGLDGEWHYGGVSVVGFYSPSSGFTPGSSKGGALKFYPDGRYEQALMLDTVAYGCASGAFAWRTGRWGVDGDQLTLREAESKVNSADGCSGKASAKSVPLETRVYTVQILPSSFGSEPQLFLVQNGQVMSGPYKHD
jgi:hypothetical protein